MKSIKILFKRISVMLLCTSMLAFVGCSSSMSVSHPAKKQASTTTSTPASTSNTKKVAASGTNTSTSTPTTIDGQAKADGSTSKGRKGAK